MTDAFGDASFGPENVVSLVTTYRFSGSTVFVLVFRGTKSDPRESGIAHGEVCSFGHAALQTANELERLISCMQYGLTCL